MAWARGLAAVLVGLALAGLTSQTTLFPRVSWWVDDALQRRFAAVLPLEHVAVVDVDEVSMQRLQPRVGAWPYPREVFAQMQRFLTQSGARVVAYDIVFAEPRTGDEALAAALDERAVLAAAALPYPYARSAQYREHLASVAPLEASAHPQIAAMAYHWNDLTLPIAQLTDTSHARVAVISTAADGDGVVRRVRPVHAVHGRILPALSVGALLAEGRTLRADGAQLMAGELVWPLAADGSLAPRLPANYADLTVLPFHQVLGAAQGAPGTAHIADLVRDRIVLIGSSSAFLGDYTLTPAGRLPGLNVNALILESLRAGEVLKPPSTWLNAALLLLAIALPFGLTYRGASARPRDFAFGLGALITLMVGAVLAAAYAGQQSSWLFAVVAGLTAYGAALAVWLFALYQEKQRLYFEKAAALEAARLKTEFLNHMTHELRTPITAIMGFNKFNLYGDDIGKAQRLRHSGIIARNCDHLLALVNNNLDLARMEAGQMKFDRTSHEIRALLDDVATTLRVMAHEKQLALEQEVSASVPHTLLLDAFRVRQVLINLLGNAIKFTAKGKVTLAADWRDGELRCEVRDTGPGIPPDSLERIFVPFQRAPGVTAAGTGLGLSITKKLVELMGGSLSARSQVGVGSTFEIRIPAPAGEQPPQPVEAPAPPPAAAAKLSGRVLLADDNADLRDLVKVQLGELGFDCKAVGDGLEAIEAALAEPYTIVLLDMDMPFMDGYETVRVLRERGYTRPVIGFTAHQAGSPVERALIEGCDDVITKPVSLERLREALAPLAEGTPAPQPAAGANAIRVTIDSRVRALAVRFLSNCGRDLQRLRAALDGSDFAATRAIGHALGGAGGSYGFDEITRIGRAIEEQSKRGDATGVSGLVGQLEDYLSRVHPEYR
jgi:signal transduction histidine kinase/CheY-like chemotaxis protein/HPt (histidine-containing phosphotransfer) domain-containing protein